MRMYPVVRTLNGKEEGLLIFTAYDAEGKHHKVQMRNKQYRWLRDGEFTMIHAEIEKN